ncbi:MAG: hypothetical protein RBJ76_13460 [Stenomitos frigidus ULC029]
MFNLSAEVENTYDHHYVAKQVTHFNQNDSQDVRLDCLWRIASHADLYTPEALHGFTEDGMSDEVQDEILDWLEDECFYVED